MTITTTTKPRNHKKITKYTVKMKHMPCSYQKRFGIQQNSRVVEHNQNLQGLVPPLKASGNAGDRGQSPILLSQVASILAGLQISSLKSDYSMTLGLGFVHIMGGAGCRRLSEQDKETEGNETVKREELFRRRIREGFQYLNFVCHICTMSKEPCLSLKKQLTTSCIR